MRPYLLKLLHRNSAPNIELEQFAINLGEWELIPLIVNDVIVGTLAEKDGEIHMAIEPQFRKKSTYWRTGLKLLIEPLINKYGYVITRVKKDDLETRKFVRRLGFTYYDSLGEIAIYAMSEIKFGRKVCQQQL
jgi:hypothetical protein